MQFSKIHGLSHIKDKLIQAVKKNHVAHAQMFAGLQGSANMAIALAYATYINCENKQEEDSCGQCASCVKMNKLVHPDIHFVFPVYSQTGDKEKIRNENVAKFRAFLLENPFANLMDWADFAKADNKQLNISVEESRRIVGNISMKSFEAEFKLVFIWLPELMNAPSANAILKALEEPPEKTLFFLVTNDLEKNITTIRSRTQIIQVPSFQEEEIQEILQTTFAVDPILASKAALLCEGDLNQGLKLSHEIKNDSFPLFRDWLRSCYKLDFTLLIEFAESFSKLPKASQKSFYQFGMSMIRSVLLIHSGGDDLVKVSDEEKAFVTNLATVLPLEKLEGIEKLFNDAFYHLERNASAKIENMNSAFELIRIIRKK